MQKFWNTCTALITPEGGKLWRFELLAFVPAFILGWYWLGGMGLTLMLAVALPVLVLTSGAFLRNGKPTTVDGLTGLPLRDTYLYFLEEHMRGKDEHLPTAFVVEIDDFYEVEELMGRSTADELLPKIANRLTGIARVDDICARLEGPRFAIGIAPTRRINLETALQLCERIQKELSEPYSIEATTLRITVSVGFCLGSRAPMPGGEALLEAAQVAAEEARRQGSAAIRAYSSDMRDMITSRNELVDDIVNGFDEGQFQPWFQPQIDAETGRLTGVEALARWEHPKSGVLLPGKFLPSMEAAGLMERLGEVMLSRSLAAMRKWDKEGLIVPTIGVNFSSTELRNPKLVDRIQWELDKFELKPQRLTIEILETVVAETEDDTISRNIAELAKLGCNIDLDDFGTGHASIANIRRFAVNRLKIDRSFVMQMHEDTEQYKVISAILLMAKQLDLDALAEGVENLQQQEMLASLGCHHLQGFGISRPIPFDEMTVWGKQRVETEAPTVRIV
ncbi:bifunctional diguanylate cyclase/phosphodiesterase [Alphaproteobacteria bacterium KMM 3653]|uniref:Bifunctional diguanylate cyclase/phosphodiesterase n=1 Tax=Harenicola maris TaxID=2841044 RepID=A0AAP2CLC6_9RHOB|nr:bifunctional diguanylate cyclase/phosphodiesterase [Harenicola maris]